jgi:hypothetical protein
MGKNIHDHLGSRSGVGIMSRSWVPSSLVAQKFGSGAPIPAGPVGRQGAVLAQSTRLMIWLELQSGVVKTVT